MLKATATNHKGMVIGYIVRLTDDPFAVLGVIVLIVGLFVVASGLQHVVRR